jgi:DNA primase
VPLLADHAFDVVSVVARAIAGLVALRDDEATTEFLKEDRAGRVFVDWLRNGWGSSIASPWSVRAKPGAPVVTPIPWDRIGTAEPDQWSITDVDAAPSVEMPAHQSLDPDPIIEAAADSGVDLETSFDRFGRKR